MNHLVTITKSDGAKQLFEEQKLVNSLSKAGASKQAVDEVVAEIEREMWEGMPTADIYKRAFDLLRKQSHHAALKYSIRRAIFDLGPDGFPFEKFVARIFNVWGYEAVTDQTLMGTCGVEHEVDVVAWKGDELAMTEAKFHNEIGLRSDLKVSLYVKARFDDLADNFFDYGGKPRKLSSRWLFTNTKFTDSAVKYGECKDIHMIGWNHPAKGNLHELVEEHALHPITSLPSLSHQQKRDLLGHDILVCSDIVKNPGALHSIGLNDEAARMVVKEARMIVDSVK
ncbi:hypothetical protein KGQ27_00965 [Patescibacteria group bacterium]|nr:hypothetical protein [Patescibacteria group bacterium]MDE1946584.1 hypothetical protein [Patescibacteria group bacterium]MDE2010853.1 hypothetical protein [Patescibacteria group bacterium]MDE2233211.1 hypothetical protein [Patescibacteria group bacterium]